MQSDENVVGSARNDTVNGDFNTVDGGPGKDTAHGKIKHKVSANGESDPVVRTPGGAVVGVFSSTLIIRGGHKITVKAHRDEGKIDKVDIIEEITETLPGGQKVTKTVKSSYPVNGPIDSVLLEGGRGNDQLRVDGFGADVPVRLSGGKGNDTLVGGQGNDILNDGAGDDKLFGGGGDDGLTNSRGKDHLFGQDGNDLLVSSSIDKGDRLGGGKGLDNVSFAQMPHDPAHPGRDLGVRAKIGGTARRIDKDGKGHGPSARIAGSVEDLEGSEGDDVLIGNGKNSHLMGRGGDDTLLGRRGDRPSRGTRR
ncbi:MAG: hypothetical protein E6J90_04195 [Deltaproteobacteria bacterium]|nr:MAG: hypothetical protein E6J90_04195 [Deltaproteobacteria bacterium]